MQNTFHLNPDRRTICRYIGIRDGKPDEQTEKLIDEAIKLLEEDIAPAQVYAAHDCIKTEEGVKLSGCALVLAGNDIKSLLAESDRAVLLCATLGPGVDARIRQLQVSNVALALVYDAAASVAIDDYCDGIQAEIREKLPDMKHTMRFSPGYGDLPLESQGDFLRAVNAEKRAGVRLTAGGMLTPIKTITAVFGLVPADKESDSDEKVSKKPHCGTPEACSICDRKSTCSLSCIE